MKRNKLNFTVRKTRRMVQTSTIKTIENLMYITIAAYGGLTSTTVAARWAIRLKFNASLRDPFVALSMTGASTSGYPGYQGQYGESWTTAGNRMRSGPW
ncbi:hypothetical protein AFLA70_128g002641 [Aspergillus flavus AF70]|nr:hypothetical protein AFLA70_128g002641 [Aspergillus flavus AF70]